MDIRDRLKQLGVHKGPGAVRTPEPKPRSGPGRNAIERLVPGVTLDTEHGPCYVVDTPHPAQQAHGGLPLGDYLEQTRHAALIAEFGRDAGLAGADLTRAAFLDTETTGLGGNAGTLVFLVGVGTFEPAPAGGLEFRLRQFFLREPDEEPAMLAALGALVAGRPLVTFNGRGFDVPLLEGRYILSRARCPMSGAPHLDLLQPARRLYRERVGSCALGALEQSVLGVVRDDSNVPGWLIPQLYADYLRSGNAREMPRVLYHNRVDVLSMVTLAAQLCRAFADPGAPGMPAQDVLSLGRWHQARGDVHEAERLFRAAALGDEARADALRALGFLLRHLERREEAAQAWSELAALPGSDVEAHVELAKYYEWTARDPARAAQWTAAALARVDHWPGGIQKHAMHAELEHRLQRVSRKAQPAPKQHA